MTEQTKVIEIVRGINDQVTGYRERIVEDKPLIDTESVFNTLLEAEQGRRRYTLMEALVLKPDAANMLRDGFRFLSFSRMRAMEQPWKAVVRAESSSKPEEMYLRDADFGTIPKKPSGEPVDFVTTSFEGATKVVNDPYRMGVLITGDDIKFDRIGKVRQTAEGLGRSAVVTENDAFYTDITTTGNYTRNSTTGDNDVGANTGATTFNALGLDTALTTISTSKDRKSGKYLHYAADTIFLTPKMEYPAKQMLMAPILARAADTGAAEVRGMGTYNPYQGSLRRIIVAPELGSSYQWAICDSTIYSYVWQTVESWQILQEGQIETSEAWLIMNAIRYVIMGYFGHGFVDDRAWYYSSSTTAPTVS